MLDVSGRAFLWRAGCTKLVHVVGLVVGFRGLLGLLLIFAYLMFGVRCLVLLRLCFGVLSGLLFSLGRLFLLVRILDHVFDSFLKSRTPADRLLLVLGLLVRIGMILTDDILVS